MEREVDNHDAVLLHDAHEEEKTDHRIKRERGTENPERHQTADDRGEKRGEHRNRMDIALVENSENHIHDKERRDNEKGQSVEELLQDKAFTLQLAFHRRRQHFRRRFLDVVGHIAQGDARFGVETKVTLVNWFGVIDRLQAESLLWRS